MNPKGALSAGTHLLTVLGVNAVPAVGVFAVGTQVEYFLKRRPVTAGQS